MRTKHTRTFLTGN